MTAAEWVLVCTLELLGRSSDRLPRIEILHTRPSVVSANAAAFVNATEHTVYLIASSPPFRAAATQMRGRECRDVEELKAMAGILAHELWHLSHGPDEKEAYLAELMELRRLGIGPGRGPYFSALRSMETVRKSEQARGAAVGRPR
jgi:hypothetical protein